MNPKTAIEEMLAFNSRDWGQDRADAWLYGIVLGWDRASRDELAAKYGWSEDAVDRLRYLHLAWKRLEVSE